MKKKNDVQTDKNLKTNEQFYYWAMDFIWNKAQEIMDKEFKEDNSGSDIINDLYYKQHYEAKVAKEKFKQKDHSVEFTIQIEDGDNTDTIVNRLIDFISEFKLPMLIEKIENIKQLKKIIWLARKKIWTLRWNR